LPESGELAGFLASDTTKALAAGLSCRPVGQTVTDTWAWVQRAGVPRGRLGREPGLPLEIERALLSGG
jgi:hypothetical protein